MRVYGPMTPHAPGVRLSLDLDDEDAVPYFLWDDPMTLAEFRSRLGTAQGSDRVRLLGKVMREARDADAWRFTTPAEVQHLWPELERHLGRRLAFWRFLLGRWRDLSLDGTA